MHAPYTGAVFQTVLLNVTYMLLLLCKKNCNALQLHIRHPKLYNYCLLILPRAQCSISHKIRKYWDILRKNQGIIELSISLINASNYSIFASVLSANLSFNLLNDRLLIDRLDVLSIPNKSV